MTLSLTFDLEDSALLFHTGMPSSAFREEDQTGRFDNIGKNKAESSMPELVIASPSYDDGSILWCSTATDALLLKKIHLASGYEAVILWDNYGENNSDVYVVLTSWNLNEDDLELTSDEIVAELVTMGDESESRNEIVEGISNHLSTYSNVERLGAPNIDDHGDHFHITFVLKLPGDTLKTVVSNTASTLERSIGYAVVSDA